MQPHLIKYLKRVRTRGGRLQRFPDLNLVRIDIGVIEHLDVAFEPGRHGRVGVRQLDPGEHLVAEESPALARLLGEAARAVFDAQRIAEKFASR